MGLSAHQYVIASKNPAGSNGLAPIGTREQITRDLANFNTAPEREGEDVLYGPGIRLELPPGHDLVTQILLSITEEEIAWQAITRIAKRFNWKVVDMNTGRELNA